MLHITITNVEISPTLVFNMCWWGWSCIWICSHHITIVINIVFCISLWLPLIHSFMSLPPIFIPSRQMSEECYDKVFLLRTIDFSPLPWMGVFHWLARCDRCLISAYSDILKWAWISRVMWSCVIKNKKRWSCSLGSSDDRVEGGGAHEVIVHRILITLVMTGWWNGSVLMKHYSYAVWSFRTFSPKQHTVILMF